MLLRMNVCTCEEGTHPPMKCFGVGWGIRMQGGAEVKEPGKKSLEFRFSWKFFPEPQKCPPGRCPVLTLGGSSAGRAPAHTSIPCAEHRGSRGSSVTVRAERSEQLELVGIVLAWISHCLHNYETTDNRKGANSLFRGARTPLVPRAGVPHSDTTNTAPASLSLGIHIQCVEPSRGSSL